MTTEMQEIAITEEKPLLTGQADAAKVRDAGVHTRIMHVNVHTHAHHCAHMHNSAYTKKQGSRLPQTLCINVDTRAHACECGHTCTQIYTNTFTQMWTLVHVNVDTCARAHTHTPAAY